MSQIVTARDEHPALGTIDIIGDKWTAARLGRSVELDAKSAPISIPHLVLYNKPHRIKDAMTDKTANSNSFQLLPLFT
jgi:hypothetical protein